MTNTIAIWLFLLICAGFALDLVMGWGGTLALLRILADLINVLVFWR